jgi:aspartyl-tRNA(Asn)/glutamyl-tRNA(Gln) amidotransferase subunit A
MTELHWLSAADAARAFRERSVSPVELVTHVLDRIAARDHDLNVFVRLDAEGAMDAARAAEREIAAGRSLGPLHGIPVGIKDIIDVRGLPTTCHSRILLDNVAETDAAAVARLRAAGAIILGKVATHEFALGGPSFDLPFPPARNPWNRDHHPGGSSSGSGAGVAAGFFPLALGSDTAGSIRNPAGACGVFGIKPTYDLVPRGGVFPLAFTLDHVGALTRTVADAAIALDVLAAGPRHAPIGDPEGPIRGLRIGIVRNFFETDMEAVPEVAAAVEHAAYLLAAEGAVVTSVALPNLRYLAAIGRTILQGEAWTVHAAWMRNRPQDYARSTRRRLLPGALLSASDYIDAQRRRREAIDAVERTFRDVDVLLTANALDPACRIDDDVSITRTYPRQARTPFNVTGHPAASIMAGLSPDGLPLAIQLVGRYYDERTLLRVAARYERATGAADRHPDIRTDA